MKTKYYETLFTAKCVKDIGLITKNDLVEVVGMYPTDDHNHTMVIMFDIKDVDGEICGYLSEHFEIVTE